MKLTNKQRRWWEICQIAYRTYGLNIEKDFFELDSSEMDRLDKLCILINYHNSEPEEGRSTLRQLWYDLHKWNVSLNTPF